MRILTIPLVLTVCIAAGEAASFRRESLSLGRQEPSAASYRHVKKEATEEEDRLVVARGGDQVKGGDATMTAMVFNLVNNVAGAGILSLSAGQAAGTGWIPAIAISVVLGLISAKTFAMVGEACDMLGESDFKGLWARTIGEKSAYAVDGMIAFMCLAVCVIYSGILGDSFTPLLGMVGLPEAWNGRKSNIIVIATAFLLPMSLIKNLSALAFTSILGFCAIMYTVLFINYRALDGSYKIGSGKFVTDGVLKVLPSFEKSSLWNINFSSLVLASNLGLAYVAHYNSPSMYRELKDTNSKRYSKMVNIAYTLLIMLYLITMGGGYSTFGDNTIGNILLNYHPKDMLAVMGQLATGLSILFGFPLVAAGARESLIGAARSLGYPQLGAAKNHFKLVATMLTLTTFISVCVTDVSLVMGLTGAALGSFICYICPSMIYVKAVEISKGKDSPEYKAAAWKKALVPFGYFIGGLGVLITIRNSMEG